jgi:hypothetical protein
MAQLSAVVTQYNQVEIAEAIDSITAGLERVTSGFQTLKSLLMSPAPAMELDPKAADNKYTDGKLTPKGVEICYRLFDSGKTRYAVAALMDISFGGADHRYEAWKSLGGVARIKQPIE